MTNKTDLNSFLASRRSTSLKAMADPAPRADELETILKNGTRVPDHGKYMPWYILSFTGDARKQAGELLRAAYATENPDAAPAKLDLEAERFMRAPVVLAVVSRVREGKHAAWEQILSAGAVCYNLCLSANALGYGTNWLTEWYAYSPAFKKALGLADTDNFAGFIYIGTPTEKQEDRDRPDLSRIVTHWTPGATLNTGDGYGMPGHGLPSAGFNLKD